MTAWDVTCCLPALLALWRLDHWQPRQQRWWWHHSTSSAAVEAVATTMAAAATPYYSCACSPMSTDAGPSCPCGFACGVNSGNEVSFAAKVHYGFVLITRLNSHAICGSTQACSISVCLQPVCGLVRGLRPRHPLSVACGLCHPHRQWPRGPHSHAPTGPCHALCLAALVLGAVTHLDDCVRSGHYWRCVAAPWQLAH